MTKVERLLSLVNIRALAAAVAGPVAKAREAGYAACEKCRPGCGQTWFRCPACDTLHSEITRPAETP